MIKLKRYRNLNKVNNLPSLVNNISRWNKNSFFVDIRDNISKLKTILNY
jgi:hypothetical protein